MRSIVDTNKQLAEEFKKAVGGRVVAIRCLTDEEIKATDLADWAHEPIIMVELDTRVGLILSQDPEGNGPGFAMVAEFTGGPKPAPVPNPAALELVKAITMLRQLERQVTPSVLLIRQAADIVSQVMNKLANGG